MNVVVYARYSSHNQTEQSIEGQLEVCKKYAEQHNYNIIRTYVDRAISGTTDERPQFLKMIEDSDTKQFEGVLVYKLDRFARNRFQSAIYKDKLKKNGVILLSAMENINDSPESIILESVLEGMNEYFSVELGQKVKRGMKINADNCYYNGGTIPLGYKLIEVNSSITDSSGRIVKKKKYAIDEDTAPIVEKIFEMYNGGYLMADIIKYLNKKNIKTSVGGDFNKNSIRKILLNKKYIGIYTYNGVETIDGIPRIIDDETFNKTQEIMFKNKKAPARARAKTDYLLTTKLFCGHCKEMMTGYSGTSKTGKLHSYYMCNNAKKKQCNKKAIQKNYIEDLIVEQARKILTDENINRIANEVVNLANKEKNNATLKRLTTLLKENEKQRANLFDSLKICEIDSVKKSIFEEINKMEIERVRIKDDIAIEESQQIKLTTGQVKYFLVQLKRGDINDTKYRKLLINTLVYRVYLYDNGISIYFNTQDKPIETKIPSIEIVESSLMGNDGLPLENKTNFYYYIGGFVVHINIDFSKEKAQKENDSN